MNSDNTLFVEDVAEATASAKRYEIALRAVIMFAQRLSAEQVAAGDHSTEIKRIKVQLCAALGALDTCSSRDARRQQAMIEAAVEALTLA